ncbi:hypothetical protein [Candidatus Nitrosotenuis cloacae]|uniref:Uncharacterized protein n=1 Tax=Candidatus Nitrosotenuis cloacae TaxID=1603555 RepID=A0A3G1B1Y8_9ARCH|nr:hypothetical protein [Candidatus Nitrosotenuis cloacae]AJZ75879.1 hypothetical protein SU86_005310 [Candidatus Nitrosotenuis cloacae]
MKTKNQLMIMAISAVFAGGIIMTSANAQSDEEHTADTFIVRDTVTEILGGKSIPAKEYIHFYDTTPYMIMNGHVAAKLPCDKNAKTPLEVLIGKAPDLKAAEMEYIKELSKPGLSCLYHVDLNSDEMIVTDVALSNPTDKPVRFPPTSTVTIGINEIMPMEEESGH